MGQRGTRNEQRRTATRVVPARGGRNGRAGRSGFFDRGLLAQAVEVGLDRLLAHPGGLVGDVDGVLEREVPDGEGFELGVSRAAAALVLVVELGEAGGEFAAARARPRDDDEGLFGFDVGVGAVAGVADNGVDVGGVSARGWP